MTETQGMPGTGQAGQMNIANIEETMMNIVHTVASFFTYPVEIGLRPQYGTTYFSAPIMFISLIMLVLASTFFGIATAMTQMIPFVHIAGPSGMFGLGSFTTLVFLASLIHGFRLWRRMIRMELEAISSYEGPALPLFTMLPYGTSFYFVRIIYEPIFLFALAILLGNLGIIQLPLMLYLQLTSILLAMKEYVSWYRNWLFIRRLMDTANAAPTIAKIVSNTATDDELARVHLASLPQNLAPDMRRATVSRIAHAYSVPMPEEEEK